MLLPILLALLSTPVDGGLRASYVWAGMAWGRAPSAPEQVSWCDSPGAQSCWWMQNNTLYGYWDGKCITISKLVPDMYLQSVVSHEVGHALGVAHTEKGLMSANDWTEPVALFPSPEDLELIPRR